MKSVPLHSLNFGLLKRMLFLMFFTGFLFTNITNAQTRGIIFEPATNSTGRAVLDPDGNGFVSMASTGFSASVQGSPGNDVPEFEMAFMPFPTIGSGEKLSDIRSGPDEGFTDFSVTDNGEATYYYYDGTNLIFRFRLADYRPNAKGYTVLLDTDDLFGPGIDPQYSDDNPGFEIAIVLKNKNDVFVYNVNSLSPGCLNDTEAKLSYTGGTHHQKSISGIEDDDDLDYFYDFYVPISALTSAALGGVEITASTNLRMTATTNTSNTFFFCGSVSDIGGVDDDEFGDCINCIFEELIDCQVGDNLANLTSNGYSSCRTDCPIIDGSYPIGTVNVMGTAVPGSTVRFYLNGIQVVSALVIADAIDGTYTSGNIVTTSTSDVITVSSEDTNNSLSESRLDCATTTITNVPECTGASAQVVVGVPTNSGTAPISVTVTADFNLDNAILAELFFFSNGDNITDIGNVGTIGLGTIGVPTVASGVDGYTIGDVIEWEFTMNGSGSDKKVPCGTMYITMEDKLGGLCASTSPLACNTTGSCQAAASTAPEITSGVTVSTSQTISGTSEPSDTITLYINGVGIGETTTSDPTTGIWNITNVNLSGYACQMLTATANGTDECASPESGAVPVTSTAIAPLILGSYCAGTISTVYGSSAESNGTVISITFSDGLTDLSTGTATVVNGTWTATMSPAITTGGTLSATALNALECKTISTDGTAAVTAASSGITLIVNSGIIENTGIITGTYTGTPTSIAVYIDQIPLGSANFDAGLWSISGLSSDLDFSDLIYAGGKVTASYTTAGNCESGLSGPVVVACATIPDEPIITYTQLCTDISSTSTTNIINTQFSITNITASGVMYRLLDSNDDDLGYTFISTAADIGTTKYFTTIADRMINLTGEPPKIFVVEASIFNPGVSCAITASKGIYLNPVLPSETLIVGADNATLCSNGSTNVTVENSVIGISYQLRNNLGDVIVGSPVIGTGDTIELPTGTLTSDTTFNIYATHSVTNCAVELTSTQTITVSAQSIDAGTDGTLSVCEGVAPTEAELFAALQGSPDSDGTWANVGLIYTYTVAIIAPCTATATATVTVTEQSINAGTNGTLIVCEGVTPSNAELFVELGGTPDLGGAWTNVGLIYTYTVTATAPCTGTIAATVIVTEQSINAGTNGSLSVCQGVTPTNAELFAELGGTPDSGGSWTNVGLIYTYTVTATAPCTGTKTATVTVSEETIDAGTNGTLSVCQGITPTNAELFAELGGTPDSGGTWTNVGLVYTYTVTATAPCTGTGTAIVTVSEQTIDSGTNGTLSVCEGVTPTEAELFAELGGTPDLGGAWTNVGLIYTYTVTATAPCTGTIAATVIVTEQSINAGTNGSLSVCQGVTPTNAELFAELGGAPDSGGSWTNVGLIYTYTVTATAPCTGTKTATVTVSEETIDAGTNGTLSVCQGITPTNAELFAELGGTPDSGGTWTNVGLVYTYTVTASTPCTGTASAVVTVSEQSINAGTNGTLSVCQGVTPTNAELFAELGGTPDTGGVWTNVGLIYTYTVTAISPCTNTATATVTLVEQIVDAGTNGDLTVCTGVTPTEAELFLALEGTPDTGGVWTNIGLVYTYTMTAIAPCTGTATATVTVSEESIDAGTNGVLSMCTDDIPTEAELFAALGGTPDTGGDWTNDGPIYTYTVSGSGQCNDVETSEVVVSIDITDTDGDGVTDCDEMAGDTDPLNPCDFILNDITVEVTAIASCNGSLKVIKIISTEATEVGETIRYTITIENTGESILSEISLVDIFIDFNGETLDLTTLPYFISSDLGSEEGELLIGEIATYFADFEITESAIRSGGISNSVFVEAKTPGGTIVDDISDNGNDFDGNTEDDATILELGCLIAYSEFSPNGDGYNDTFIIGCIENYPNNKLSVYNRWGNIVYQQKGYSNDWNGTSNGRSTLQASDKLPVGSYYYVLELGDGSKPKIGWLYINR